MNMSTVWVCKDVNAQKKKTICDRTHGKKKWKNK